MTKEKFLEAKIKKSSVPVLYGKIAAKYDLWAGITESRASRRCLELANIQNGESVLEVAVGTGLAFAEILALNPAGRNEGIDITEEMLERARERAKGSGTVNYRLSLGDAYNLDYGDSTFDVLVSNYLFDLLPECDFPVVLAEFKRVLRPGGRLVLTNMARGEHWYQGIWEIVYRINPSLMGGCRGVSLLPYVRDAGFQETKKELFSQNTFPSEVVYGIKPG